MHRGRIVVASGARGRRLLARARLNRAAWQTARLAAPERPEQSTREIVREYLERCAQWPV